MTALSQRLALLSEGQGGAGRCPGEDDCERWAVSEEPKTDACLTCPMNGTKPVKISILTALDSKEIDGLIERIEQLASEQRAGFPIRVDEISPLEFELLKLWHSAVAAYERAHQHRISALVEALVRRGW